MLVARPFFIEQTQCGLGCSRPGRSDRVARNCESAGIASIFAWGMPKKLLNSASEPVREDFGVLNQGVPWLCEGAYCQAFFRHPATGSASPFAVTRLHGLALAKPVAHRSREFIDCGSCLPRYVVVGMLRGYHVNGTHSAPYEKFTAGL